MKILVASDLHSDLDGVQKLVKLGLCCDLVLITGDLVDMYTPFDKSCEIIETVKALKNIVLVHGNNEGEEVIEEYHKIFLGRYLNFSSIKMKGFQIVGIGGAIAEGDARHYPNFGKELYRLSITDNLPKIVISHYPGRGINDFVSSRFHVGFPEINKFVAKVKPILLVTGHIHEAAGVSEVEILDNKCKPKENPKYDLTEFDFKKKENCFLAINPAYAYLRGFVQVVISDERINGGFVN